MKPQPTNHNKSSVRLFTEKHVENLETIFKNLYKNEVLSDVTFHCKDGSVKAHKAILASSSSYFRKIFYEHPEPEAVYIMYGISVRQMRSLIELIYRGNTEVPSDVVTSVYEMVNEMGVKGIICTDDQNDTGQSESPSSTHSRDTRFRGTKRVAVNFEDDQNHSKRQLSERRLSTASSNTSERSRKSGTTVSTSDSSSEISGTTAVPTFQKSSPIKMNLPRISNNFDLVEPKTEPQDGDNDRIEATIEQEVNEIAKKTSWQLKQRKFKCQLCPSSFKRASHLSRHQLVHTGERPWPCGLCDKAFSRHDKLKNHIKKNHEDHPENENLLVDVDDSLYTIGHVQILTPSANGTYNSFEEDDDSANKITREDLEPPTLEPIVITDDIPEHTLRPPLEAEVVTPQKEIFEEKVQSNKLESGVLSVPQKKGRGRPRKYPPGCWPLKMGLKPHKLAIPQPVDPTIIPLRDVVDPPPKKRGRPPKVEKTEPINSGFLVVQKRKMGRPKVIRKTEKCQDVPSSSDLVLGVQKKLGRKPKIFLKTEQSQDVLSGSGLGLGVQKKKRGRRPKNFLKTQQHLGMPAELVVQKRKGGRPRLNPLKQQNRPSETFTENHVAVVEKRKRGPKPKNVLKTKNYASENSSFEVLQKQKRPGRPRKYPPVILKLKRKYVKKIRAAPSKEQPVKDISSSSSTLLPQKRGRGRPRIRPEVPKPLFKRPRGRPRLNAGQNAGQERNYINPYSRQPVNILPKPLGSGRRPNNYDITNMPFGDLESLMSSDAHSPSYMEPYVEIKTEHHGEDQEFTDASEMLDKTGELAETTNNSSASSFLENIGLSAVNPIGQIGQCTISLSTGCHTTEELRE